MDVGNEVFEIALSDIMPNRFQPREIFDENALNELAESIKTHGVIQPIIVRKVGDKFEIIAGERRFRASQRAGLTTIPALVKNLDDKETAKIALLENLQREDLTPIEEAKTYQTILKLENKTQEELARDLGKSQSTIANKIRLLNLDEAVQTALLNSKISERHARSLLNIEDKNMQRELLNRILLERLTVKQLDDEIARITGKKVQEEETIDLNNVLENEEDIDLVDPTIKINETNSTDNPMFGLPQINKQEEQVIKPENKIENTVLPNTEKSTNVETNQVFNTNPVIDTNPVNNRPNFNIFEALRENNNQELYEVNTAVSDIKNVINNIQNKGISITAEDFDFENIYQIVIKIDKNK